MTSGRRSAPGRLGAYYQDLDVIPIGIGSYEPFAGTPEAPGPAEQTIIGVVQVAAAAGPYTVWAERAGSAGFAPQSARNRLLYPLNDQQIIASERMIGEPPSYLAVFTDGPVDSAAVARAFDDTRYKWAKTEAIYSQADPNRVPKMKFLHWAELRPTADWKGRGALESAPATRLVGSLVFPIATPLTGADREPPQASFDEALRAQFPASPAVVAAPEDGSAVAISQAGAKSALTMVSVLGLGAAAIWLGYKATRGLQRSHA